VAEGALLVAADETGISQVPTVVRTWAPRGHTPVVRHAFNWKKLSLLLLATPCGLLLRDMVAGAFRSGRILTNLKALVEVFKDRRIVVLWDGAPIHRSRAIARWLERPEVKARLEIVRLPPYAPELNPAEVIFSALKRKRLGNFAGGEDLGDLARRTNQGLDDIDFETIKGCFRILAKEMNELHRHLTNSFSQATIMSRVSSWLIGQDKSGRFSQLVLNLLQGNRNDNSKFSDDGTVCNL